MSRVVANVERLHKRIIMIADGAGWMRLNVLSDSLTLCPMTRDNTIFLFVYTTLKNIQKYFQTLLRVDTIKDQVVGKRVGIETYLIMTLSIQNIDNECFPMKGNVIGF
jgi:hypothetical protein